MQRDPNPPKSTVERILAESLKSKDVDEKVIENEKEYKAALNAVAKTRNGRLVLKYVLRYSKIYSVSTTSDVLKLADERTRKNFWLEMFGRYLDKTNRMEIE